MNNLALLAVEFSVEAMVVIASLLTALVTALVFIYNQFTKSQELRIAEQKAQAELRFIEQKSSYELRIKELDDQRKSYKEISSEAISALEAQANEKRLKQGKEPLKVIAPVVPEHSSPVTKEQQETADLQTMRARAVAIAVALDLPVRVGADPETYEQRMARLEKEQSPKEVKDKTIEVAVNKVKEVAVNTVEVANKAVDVVDEHQKKETND
jgi:hypothetical protein